MKTEFGTKISETIFLYHLTGWKRNLTFDAKKRRVMLINSEDGTILNDKDLGEDGDMNYEDFLLFAMNFHLDLIDSIHSN